LVSNTTKTVLVVDDDPAVRQLVRVTLELLGHAVVDAAEALEVAAGIRRPIDLL